MENVHYYEVSVDWKKDRIGELTSPVLTEHVMVATPPEFTKGIPDIWSPEHLFVAAINSCLMTTFLAVAENFKYEFANFTSKAVGKLEIVDGKYMMSEVTLMPELTIADENDREKGLKILNKSEAACLISNSVKSKIIFEPIIKVNAVTV
jgi:organic hydroperoxide reductase OsmC/OhrA